MIGLVRVIFCDGTCEEVYVEVGMNVIDLLQKAMEAGWIEVPFPGAPWRKSHYCPAHADAHRPKGWA